MVGIMKAGIQQEAGKTLGPRNYSRAFLCVHFY